MTAANVSRIPANAPKPQDRQPKKRTPAARKAAEEARQAEATDGYVTIEVCGVSMKIPIGTDLPLEAYIAFKKGDEIGGTELLLGAEQWAQFMAQKPTLGDFNEIGRLLEEATGN